MDEAEIWYESQAIGLGAKFVAEVDEHLRKIDQSPNSFSILRGNIRQARLNLFSKYSIMYRILPDNTLFVHSVFHASRNPKIWKTRK